MSAFYKSGFYTLTTVCVTGSRMCLLCSNFTEEQLAKIANRKSYTKKSRKSDTSRDESEILGKEGETFSGSREELEESALQYYTAPPGVKCSQRIILHLGRTLHKV